MKKSASLRKARFGSRREEVVKLLQRGFVTVAELASHTGLTDNAIRSHLLALERDGLLKRKGSRPGSRRPHHLYQLTSRAQKFLARASETALTALLDAIKQRLSVRQLRQLENPAALINAQHGEGGELKWRSLAAAWPYSVLERPCLAPHFRA